MAENIIRIQSLPGIKRDGTRFEGDQYVDGEWVRFQRGLPRKIGGYRSINKYLQGLPRALHEYTQDLLTYIHAGSADLVERFYIDSSNNVSTIIDRTPTSGFTANVNNLWSFDVIYQVGSANQIIAQVAPNLDCICNSVAGEVFTGDLLGTGVLTAVTIPAGSSATGGVVVLHPYAFMYGNDGSVSWSVPGDPTDFAGAGSGAANITGQKIIAALPMRGGPGVSPSGLFWSADSLLRASFNSDPTVTFSFDTISAQTSILSARSPIEYDGIFYWIGVDRFLMFNGVVREVENNLNANFFFDNLNYSQRQKVFALKVPRFGEIWWCFPFGDSNEPNHAIIYNVRENTWYDTPLPNDGRGAGIFPSVFRRPLMSGVAPQDYTAQAVSVTAGGAGYTVGDVLELDGGAASIHAELTVATVAAGVITAVSISNAGSYTQIPTNPVPVTGGTGSGATFGMTFNQPYKFWVHEIGSDEVDELNTRPIRSYFETADISLPVQAQQNKGLQVTLVEPDFVQTGDMTLSVHGRANARSPEVESNLVVFPDVATTPQEQVIFLKEQRRELRFRFESNTVGGDYQMGLVLAHVQPGDGTVLG
jgi:hypothetical protein